MEISPALLAAVTLIALACEYLDASIGMGYGTTLTPLLLITGFAPLEVVPAVLLGQLAGGLVGGVAHRYGPLVTGGQIIAGREARSSIGSATFAEAIVCTVAFLAYVFVEGEIFWRLAAATSIGSIVAAPLAAQTVKRIDPNMLKLVIGVATIALGAFTLLKAFAL